MVRPTPKLILPSQTLGTLEQFAFVVEATTLGRAVVERLEKQPHLPGVIIMEGKSQLLGMISRQKCFEQLGRPYGVEVYLNRPISKLHKALALPALILKAETSIEEAVRQCLARPGEQAYEPVVVQHAPGDYHLLDFHTLLTAHSQLLSHANRLIQQQNEIGQALASTLELPAVLDLILRHLNTLAPYHRASILLEENRALKLVAHRGFPPNVDVEAIRIDLQGDTLYPVMCQTRQPVTLNDATTQLGWRHFEALEPTRSWAGIPLLQRDTPLGMISLARVEVKPFTAHELSMAQTLTRQAAIAIANAQMYGQVKQFNKTLEDTVQERTHQLRETNRQLAQLDRAKGDFIEVASHELRTPLTVVNGYVQMLAHHAAIKNDPRLSEVVQGARTGLQRMQDIVNSMVEVARIDNRQIKLHLAPVRLAGLALELRRELAHQAAERQLQLDIPDLADAPHVLADLEALRKVFQQLFYNAIKYTPNGGRVWLWHRPAHLPHTNRPALELVVEDTGIGIAPEHLSLIFAKFFVTGKVSLHSSSRTKFKGGGPGLGLAIARGLVEAHGGKIWAESPGHDETALPGSRFHVVLPLASAPHTAPASPARSERVTALAV